MGVEKIKLLVEPGAGTNGSLVKAIVPTNSTPSIRALFHIDVGTLRGFPRQQLTNCRHGEVRAEQKAIKLLFSEPEYGEVIGDSSSFG
jgi:hypothetical protein